MRDSLTADHKLRKQGLEQWEHSVHTLASTFLTHVIYWDGNQTVFMKKVQMIMSMLQRISRIFRNIVVFDLDKFPVHST